MTARVERRANARALWDRLEARRVELGISKRQVSLAIGMQESYFYQSQAKAVIPDYLTLVDLAEALGLSLAEATGSEAVPAWARLETIFGAISHKEAAQLVAIAETFLKADT
jgi:transcriptional regulator with XRE-family HTH domain